MGFDNLSNYGRVFQHKVLYAILNDNPFLHNVEDTLEEEYFDSAAHKWIVKNVKQYYAKYHCCMTMEAMAIEVKKLKNNDILKVSVKDELKLVYTGTTEDIEYVKEEFLAFVRNQKVKEALLKSVDLMESGDYGNIRSVMENALKAGEPKNIGLILNKDIELRYRESEDVLVKFPEGWDVLNQVTDGGIPPGALIVIMGGTGSGKSTMACHMAVSAARQGFTVAYYTLELSDTYVGKKMDSVMTGIDMKQLKHNKALVEKVNAEVPGQLVVKEFYPGRSTMDDIESHQRHLRNDLNIEVDFVVIDYPELLRPRKYRNDNLQESNDIYTDIKGYAKETGKRIICPSQLNRSGMKADIAEHDSIAGSVGKIFIADFVLTVSRKREDKIAKTARWHVLKSRLGEDGMTYNVSMNLTTNKISVVGEYDPEEITEHQEETKAKITQKFRKIQDE
jgi:replicative DNA helicase